MRSKWNAKVDGTYKAFTTSPQEQFFTHATRTATMQYEAASEALGGIRNWTDSQDRLSVALELLTLSTAEMKSFGIPDRATGKPPLTKEFFARFKKYFPSYAVGPEYWEPPTGANTPERWRLDLTLGFDDPDYLANIEQRLHYVSAEDQRLVQTAKDLPGVLGSFLQYLDATDPRELARAIAERGLEAEASLVRSIYRQIMQGSGAHFWLVSTFAEPTRNKTSPTNVMASSEVTQILRMRREPPGLPLLESALAIHTCEM